MFSWEFCEISKNTFYIEHLWKTASTWLNICNIYYDWISQYVSCDFTLYGIQNTRNQYVSVSLNLDKMAHIKQR